MDDVVALLSAAIGSCAGAAALACGTVLVARRLTLPAAAPTGAVLAAAMSGAALVAVADVALRSGGSRAASLAARVGLLLAIAAVALPPRAATWLDVGASILAVAVAGGAVAFAPRRTSAPATARGPVPVPGRRRRRSYAPAARPPGRLRQRLARYDVPGGGDCLRGRINIAVGAGVRSAQGHVGFCPAFAELPAVEVTTDYDGVEATVSAAEVLPWGVRVEVRLAEPAEAPLEIPVDLSVRSPD